MSEEWRPVIGFEGLYEVSNLGRVRSLDKDIVCLNRWGSLVTKKHKGKILRTRPDKDGYRQLNLHRDNKQYTRKIHALVCAAFIGPRPDGLDVCHEDGNPANNRICNLRYDTRAENMLDNKRRKIPLEENNA